LGLKPIFLKVQPGPSQGVLPLQVLVKIPYGCKSMLIKSSIETEKAAIRKPELRKLKAVNDYRIFLNPRWLLVVLIKANRA
jgi:hypothetical protein